MSLQCGKIFSSAMLIQHTLELSPLPGTISISKGDKQNFFLAPQIGPNLPHSIVRLPPPGSLPQLLLGVPSPLVPQCSGVFPLIIECVVTAYFFICFCEVHEGLCLIYHGIIHHPAHSLTQRNVCEVGSIIIIIAVVVITIIIIIFPTLQMRKPKHLPKVT